MNIFGDIISPNTASVLGDDVSTKNMRYYLIYILPEVSKFIILAFTKTKYFKLFANTLHCLLNKKEESSSQDSCLGIRLVQLRDGR